MVDEDELGWFVGYRPNQKQTALEIIESTEGVEVLEEFDFIDTLLVDGDEETIQGLPDKVTITDVEKEGVGHTL